jgi:hypothetical protein
MLESYVSVISVSDPDPDASGHDPHSCTVFKMSFRGGTMEPLKLTLEPWRLTPEP